MIVKIKQWAEKLKTYISTLYIAYKHELTPWYAKLAAIIVILIWSLIIYAVLMRFVNK